MLDSATSSSLTPEVVSDNLALSAGEPARCLGCAADLDSLPATARFCPRCGSELGLDRPCGAARGRGAAEAPAGYMSGRWRRCDALTGEMRGICPGVPLGPSLILEGYANALYKLGRRYETAIGAAHNVREAERCYRKAARLGNFPALSRLAARWFD